MHKPVNPGRPLCDPSCKCVFTAYRVTEVGNFADDIIDAAYAIAHCLLITDLTLSDGRDHLLLLKTPSVWCGMYQLAECSELGNGPWLLLTETL